MKKAAGVFLCLGLILGFGAAAVCAEEAAPKPAPKPVPQDLTGAPAVSEEELEYTFGTVKSVTADAIVITEFDYDTGEEKDATYAIDPKIELNNVASLKEIVAGDEVDIDYRVDEEQKKVAKVIAVAKPLPAEAESGQ